MSSALRCFSRIAPCAQGQASIRCRRICCVVRCSAETKPEASSTTGAPAAQGSGPKPSTKREYTAWGAQIVESDERLTGPEDEKDFWEGDNMESLGRVMERFFVPGLIVLGLIVGGIAARSYNEDADVFIAPPTGPDADVTIIPAGALAPAPTTVIAPAPSE